MVTHIGAVWNNAGVFKHPFLVVISAKPPGNTAGKKMKQQNKAKAQQNSGVVFRQIGQGKITEKSKKHLAGKEKINQKIGQNRGMPLQVLIFPAKKPANQQIRI
jgi:hypothetical protein